MPISALVTDVRVLLALEPAEVGAVIMEHLNRLPPNEALSVSLQWKVLSGDALQGYPIDSREEAARALAEGWMWVLREGLVAEKPDDTHRMWYFITRKGRQLKTREQVAAYRRAGVLPIEMLHTVIASKAEPPFLRGEYDTAVFQAFKEVEVAVRTACRYPDSAYGVDMMRDAFNEKTGPLTDLKAPLPERQALAHLFAGSFGSYKNPHSHRHVGIDVRQTIEMLVLASHLMAIVDVRRDKVPKRPRSRPKAQKTGKP